MARGGRQAANAAKPHRLMLDFQNAEKMGEFIALLRKHDLLSSDVGAYPVISTDFSPAAGGVGRKQTFLIRSDDSEMNVMRGDRFVVRREVLVG